MGEPARREKPTEEPAIAEAEMQRPRFAPQLAEARPGRRRTIGSFALAAVGVLVFPILVGAIGAWLGWTGFREGDPLGRWAAGANGVIIALGVLAAIAMAA